MDVEIHPDAAAVADRTAAWLADRLDRLVRGRGRATLAVSGGGTPVPMFSALARLPVDWAHVELFQVDERVAPDGHPDRNATSLRSALLDHVPLPAANLHLMPVTADDLDAAARAYAASLPRVLDLVHLGIGDDGHTASWPPGDPLLDVHDRDVAVVGPFHGRLRMTLTPPAVNRAGAIVWQVSGASKARAVQGLLHGDPAVPAAHVRSDDTLLLADRSAAGPAGDPVRKR